MQPELIFQPNLRICILHKSYKKADGPPRTHWLTQIDHNNERIYDGQQDTKELANQDVLQQLKRLGTSPGSLKKLEIMLKAEDNFKAAFDMPPSSCHNVFLGKIA